MRIKQSVSSLIAPLWSGLPSEALRWLNRVFWWLHVLTVLGFLAYLPWSKHLHIVTSAFNVWLRSTRPKGELPWLDVEARLEAGLPLGAGDVTELTWKDHLDGYTCTECGRCEAQCPASRTGKPLSPKKLILDLKDHLFEGEADGARMVGDVIIDDVLWDCTTCRACMQACPVYIEHVPKILDMRRNLVLVESRRGQSRGLAALRNAAKGAQVPVIELPSELAAARLARTLAHLTN